MGYERGVLRLYLAKHFGVDDPAGDIPCGMPAKPIGDDGIPNRARVITKGLQ